MKKNRLFKKLFVLFFMVLGSVRMLAQEPYAVLSDNNTVLTFYYDNQKDARGGMSVGPFLASSSERWNDHYVDIKEVFFDQSFDAYTGLTSTRNWFRGCHILKKITGI